MHCRCPPGPSTLLRFTAATLHQSSPVPDRLPAASLPCRFCPAPSLAACPDRSRPGLLVRPAHYRGSSATEVVSPVRDDPPSFTSLPGKPQPISTLANRSSRGMHSPSGQERRSSQWVSVQCLKLPAHHDRLMRRLMMQTAPHHATAYRPTIKSESARHAGSELEPLTPAERIALRNRGLDLMGRFARTSLAGCTRGAVRGDHDPESGRHSLRASSPLVRCYAEAKRRGERAPGATTSAPCPENAGDGWSS
jgi:hypothetical protein